jgi:hypothetical protein
VVLGLIVTVIGWCMNRSKRRKVPENV